MIDTAAPDAERALRGGRARARRGPGARSATRSAPTASWPSASGASSRSRTRPGYRLCAFLDAETPLEIFRRLLVGSEGTLAFIAEAVFETVPPAAAHDRLWLHFPRHRRRRRAGAGPGRGRGQRGRADGRARADRRGRTRIPGTPEHWAELPPESAALLVEFRADDDARARRARGARRSERSRDASCSASRSFTRDARADRGLLARARGDARDRRHAARPRGRR